MKKWLLKYTPTLFIAFFFYAMIETNHSRPLGDLVFESIGIPAWSNGYQGLHISIFVFLFLILVIFLIRDKFFPVEVILRGKKHFLLFVVLVTIIYFTHSSFVQYQISHSDNLKTIVLNEDCLYNYSYNDGEFTAFNMEFELTNYSNDIREFEILLELSPYDNTPLQFDLETDLVYILGGNETRLFHFDLDNTRLSLDMKVDSSSIIGSGRIEYVVLKDVVTDESIIIQPLNHVGILANRK